MGASIQGSAEIQLDQPTEAGSLSINWASPDPSGLSEPTDRSFDLGWSAIASIVRVKIRPE